MEGQVGPTDQSKSSKTETRKVEQNFGLTLGFRGGKTNGRPKNVFNRFWEEESGECYNFATPVPFVHN